MAGPARQAWPTWLAALLIAASLFQAPPARAENDNRTTTVTERARPELDPLGVRLGGFIAFPNATISASYDDNILADDSGEVDDLITSIMPEIVIKSDWRNHELKFFGNADIVRHADRTDENHEDINLGAAARLDVLRDLHVRGGLTWSGLTESRASPEDVDGDEPTEYDRTIATLGFGGKSNRISYSADTRFTRLDFDNATAAGVTIINDDRDRDRFEVELRAGYEIVPEYEAFIRVGFTDTDYDDDRDLDGVDRDSDGFEIVAGARIDVTGVIFGDVFVGYVSQDYDDSTLPTIEGATAGIDLTWNVTKLTTLKFGVEREIEETTERNASGYFRTDFDASVDHELLRNLILGARAGYSLQDYEGIDRDDEVFRFALSGKYLLSRNFYISLGYEYSRRESDDAGSDYEKNVVMLRLKAQL